MPIRTIISGIINPTERMAEVTEKELDEWIRQLPSYIKDTTHFLREIGAIKTIIPPKCTLFAMDVKSFYLSIPKIEGLKTCKEEVENRTEKSIANDIHPRIQVDLRSSTSKLEFIDVLVNFNNGKIETTISTKPSDKHLYVFTFNF